MGTAIICTSTGVMTGHEASQKGVGGEVSPTSGDSHGPMSRIGRKPIAIPDGVTVDVEPGLVTVNGPKGELSQEVSRDMKVAPAERRR